MFGKKYILTLIETDSNRAYSALLKRSTLLIVIVLFFFAAGIVTYPLASGIHKIKHDFDFQKLQKENTILKEATESWKERIVFIQKTIEELNEKNKHLMTQQYQSIPDMHLGVGGPESMSRISILEYSDVKTTDKNLTRLEAEVDWLKKNMADIEEVIAKKMDRLAHYPSIRPVQGGWYSSGFGERKDPFTGKREFHPGVDICVEEGTKVLATAAGVVVATRENFVPLKGYGRYIIIDHGYGYKTRYGHLSKIMAKKGQRVKRGQIIGLTGNTGKSTSPHIHYEVMVDGKPENPFNFILD